MYFGVLDISIIWLFTCIIITGLYDALHQNDEVENEEAGEEIIKLSKPDKSIIHLSDALENTYYQLLTEFECYTDETNSWMISGQILVMQNDRGNVLFKNDGKTYSVSNDLSCDLLIKKEEEN